ncbi:MAG: lysine--tRNA ligase, partial [Myxococcota bacterium]
MSAEYKAWPYEQAQAILEKLEAEREAVGERKRSEVLLQTGFGPSGLPHIGTFGEVARTTYVAQALREMSEHETVLFTFSDDMDGFRGIPDTVEDPAPLIEHLGKPLSDVPDPFGDEDSFAGYANMKLREFLDSFDFDYVFKSSKDQYRGGVFNEGLKRIVDNYDAIRERCVRELSEANAQAWSPFKPICEECGRVNTTRVVELHPDDYTISYACTESFTAKIPGEGGERQEVEVCGCGHTGHMSVLDGNVKLGWKVDWALRWYVFGVDY